jgi:cleavage stimulation factor subunit 1
MDKNKLDGNSNKFPNYITKFITTHKNACRVAKFSPDGKYVATGSLDTSIKLLDVGKMKTYNQTKSEHGEDYAPAKPVIRTFYDHSQAVNDLEFHPESPILISCSRDCTIKFYDFSQTSIKRSFHYLQDSVEVRSISIHPSGDFLLSGTSQGVLRLYDLQTMQCYVGSKPQDHHIGPINQVRYASEGNIYVSCSKDGSIKLWDTVTNKVINTIAKAHSGFEPTSVQFSKEQKYLLSAGKDAVIKIWELSTGRQLQNILTGPQWKNRLQVTFNYNEDFILSSDENKYIVVVWDTRTGEVIQNLPGHTNVIRWIASSPIDPAIVTCSDDHRARFWMEDT